MGIIDKLGGNGSSGPTEYVELDTSGVEATGSQSDIRVHIAEIGEQRHVVEIKDAVYDGDVVIADITRHSTKDRTMEHITDELKQVATEVGGDIAQKGDDQLIITPHGVAINRDPLGQ